jgi:hypothetical protein
VLPFLGTPCERSLQTRPMRHPMTPPRKSWLQARQQEQLLSGASVGPFWRRYLCSKATKHPSELLSAVWFRITGEHIRKLHSGTHRCGK